VQPALVGRAERTTYSASGYEVASSLEHSFRQRPSDAGTILPSNHRLCSHAQPLAPFVVLSSTTTVHHTLHPFSSVPNHPLLFCPLVQEKQLFKFPPGLHEREARHGGHLHPNALWPPAPHATCNKQEGTEGATCQGTKNHEPTTPHTDRAANHIIPPGDKKSRQRAE
jgi:hypothetical protein